MPKVVYKVWFNNTPATRDQLARLDDVVVTQEMDATWEARISVPVSTDEMGRWKDADAKFIADLTRVRIAVKVGDNDFRPLIEGNIVGYDSPLSMEPGQSSVILIVRDDTYQLSLNKEQVTHYNLSDDQIAQRLFGSGQNISANAMNFESTTPGNHVGDREEFQRSSKMEMLKKLADRNGLHAYVLPSSSPGSSDAYFKKHDTKPDGLPPMVLLGAGRNITQFDVKKDSSSPAVVKGNGVGAGDKAEGAEKQADAKDDPSLGSQPATGDNPSPRTLLLPPHIGDRVDRGAAVQALARKTSFAFSASGALLTHAYGDVLSPYRVVQVRGAIPAICGNYLIQSVTHTLTRSTYTQEFVVKRDAMSSTSAGAAVAGGPRL